jgi:hypothetical protein
MPSADFLAMNPEFAAAGDAVAAPRPRTGGGRGVVRKRQAGAEKPAQSLTASPVGSSLQGRLNRAAENGWHALESPDAERYRWRQNGGAVGPWGSYEEATAYGASCCPWRSPDAP